MASLADSVREFLGRRTRQPSSLFDFVMAPILHREYLRWLRSVRHIETTLEETVGSTVHKNEPKLQRFVEVMREIGYEPKPIQIPGVDMQCFDLQLVNVEVEKKEHHGWQRSCPVVIEKVRVKESLEFIDVTIPAGTIVDRMEPNDYEKKDLDQQYERDKASIHDEARVWVVLRFGGRRRLLPSNVVERVAAERP